MRPGGDVSGGHLRGGAPRRSRRAALAAGAGLLLCLLAAACGGGGGSRAPGAAPTSARGGTSSTPAPASATTTAPSNLCGFKPSATPDKVLVIWEENHGYSDVIGQPAAPTFNAVAGACGSATDYQAVTHPSLPNYLTMTSGQSYARSPFDGDCSPGGACLAHDPSVFAQEEAAGHSWKSYAESMPSPCFRANAGPYAVRHNPAVYYPALAGSCATQDVPLGSPSSGALAADIAAGKLPTLATVSPNVDNDMHDGTVAQADAWLAQWLPVITNGPDYRAGRLAVIIAWDEGRGDGDQPSRAPLLVLSAATPPGTRTSASLDDYSVLRTIDEISGLPPLAGASSATSFTAAFHL